MATSFGPTGLYSDEWTAGINTNVLNVWYENPPAQNPSGLNSYTQDIGINGTGIYQIVASANPNRCGSHFYTMNVVATIRCWNAWHSHYTPFMTVQQQNGDTGNFSWVIYYSANNSEYTGYIPTQAHTALGRTYRYWTDSDVYLRCKITGANFSCGDQTPQTRGFHIYRIGECP